MFLTLAALALLATACGGGSVEERRCRELSERKQFAEAAVACEAAFERTSEPELGALAARAAFELVDEAGLSGWATRLRGTEAEPRALGLLAAAAERAGRVDEALDHYQARLELEQARADHRAAADTAYRAFYLAWKESRIRQALAAALAMTTAAEATGDRALRGRAAQSLFSALFTIGDLAGAARALENAGGHMEEQGADRAYWRLNQAALRLEEGRPALARVELEKARALAAASEDRALLRSIELNLAEAALAEGKLAAVAPHIEAAEALATNAGERVSSHYFRARLAKARGDAGTAAAEASRALAADPPADWRWELEWIAGQAQAELGAVRSAERTLGRSIAEVENLSWDLAGTGQSAAVLDRKRQPYEALFQVLLSQGRSIEALAVAERAVARSFTDAFVRTTLSDPTLAEPAVAGAPEWRAQSALARAESLEELGRALAGPVAVVDSQSVSAWLRALGDRRVLFYFQAGDLYYLGLLSRQRVELRPLETRVAVEERVDAWLRAPQDEAAAAVLGELLLPAWVGGAGDGSVKRWTVVSDGALGRVSFAALVRGGRRLVSSVTLGYTPSLEALFRPEAAGTRDRSDVLVLGDPKGDLPEARAELSEVAARLGVAPLLGAEATRPALRAASGARLLHLASHAGLDEAGPWLHLADGSLRPSWLLGGKVAPELVVLASCDSAGARGRGLAGSLPAAFLAAGSRAVVAALGSVEDAVARRFVLRFYQEGGAEDPAGALARTQRAFVTQGSPVSEWAPFVVLETF